MTAVKASIEAGADLFAENEDGMTAADVAVDKGHFIVAHYLLSRRMLGRTPPVALIPGEAKEAAWEATAKPKRKFAPPPPKPKAKPRVKPEMKPEPAPPPMVVAIPKPEAPAADDVAAALEGDEKIEEVLPADAPEMAEAPAPEEAAKPPAERLPLADAPEPGKPAKAGRAVGKDGIVKGIFNKLVDVLTPDFGSRDRPERLSLEPEEQLAQVEKKPAAKNGQAAEQEAGERVPKYWPVTEVEIAAAPAVSARRRRTPLLKTSLSGVTLSLGRSVTLENSYPPGEGGFDPHNRCVKKNRGTTLFCLESVDWPEAMQSDFLVPTILYTGQKAIARYDQGIASRFHALLPSDSFKRIAQYFHER